MILRKFSSPLLLLAGLPHLSYGLPASQDPCFQVAIPPSSRGWFGQNLRFQHFYLRTLTTLRTVGAPSKRNFVKMRQVPSQIWLLRLHFMASKIFGKRPRSQFYVDRTWSTVYKMNRLEGGSLVSFLRSQRLRRMRRLLGRWRPAWKKLGTALPPGGLRWVEIWKYWVL